MGKSIFQQVVFSTNGAGRTGYPLAKDTFGPPTSQHIQVNLKWIKDLHIRAKPVKLLGGNRDKFLIILD